MVQEYFDFAIQKDFPFPFDNNERRRINFRVDFINAFNHPNFRFGVLSATQPYQPRYIQFGIRIFF